MKQRSQPVQISCVESIYKLIEQSIGRNRHDSGFFRTSKLVSSAMECRLDRANRGIENLGDFIQMEIKYILEDHRGPLLRWKNRNEMFCSLSNLSRLVRSFERLLRLVLRRLRAAKPIDPEIACGAK